MLSDHFWGIKLDLLCYEMGLSPPSQQKISILTITTFYGGGQALHTYGIAQCMQTRAVLMYGLPLVAAARSLIVIKPTAPTGALPPPSATEGTKASLREGVQNLNTFLTVRLTVGALQAMRQRLAPF